jgi:transposase
VPPTDSEAVAELLRCSVRWAADLTRSARERERILKEQEAAERSRKGESNRKIAANMGVSPRTVDRMVAASKGKPFDLAQPIEADPDDPRQVDAAEVWAEPTQAEIVREKLAELAASETKEWHRALEALRGINARPSPAALFLDRDRGFDHAIGPELTRARRRRLGD